MLHLFLDVRRAARGGDDQRLAEHTALAGPQQPGVPQLLGLRRYGLQVRHQRRRGCLRVNRQHTCTPTEM